MVVEMVYEMQVIESKLILALSLYCVYWYWYKIMNDDLQIEDLEGLFWQYNYIADLSCRHDEIFLENEQSVP